ncbi:hypothetical protein KFQ04_11620 [Pseudomonas synxantha]|uniref:hypothetical protein n=1 Tax=Pseudomonas sp. HN8-3 TaxID=2886361 RepID=UPI001BF00C7B|nr:hypothetical protein [Pseudomonas sp. HN8-3]QUW67770.1 hypothetical protein KFQ04_11620 [Pseudomonas synxantha]UEH07387.1 hypothetical protein LJX92_20955 [Pseudomonas sp. HN8-3]
MKESYEVVLGGVVKEDIIVLLKDLESHSERVDDVTASEVLGIVSCLGLDQIMIAELCHFEGDVCVSAKLYGFDIVSASSDFFVLLRVIKYGEDVDVELCFDDSIFSDVDKVMLLLQKYIKEISDRVRMKEYYGGVEPAKDLDTRYFTGEMLGPLVARFR